jgi:hypothetical protein
MGQGKSVGPLGAEVLQDEKVWVVVQTAERVTVCGNVFLVRASDWRYADYEAAEKESLYDEK